MVNIRVATEEDISQILEIEQEAMAPPWTHGALLSEIYKEDSYFIIAEEDTTKSSPTYSKQHTVTIPSAHFILGYALMRQVGDGGELLKIAVEKTSRGCGVGGLLMSAVLGHAAEKKYTSVFLEVRKSNTDALRLYKKHGFKEMRIRKDYYTDPIEDAVIMIRREMSI